LQGKSFLEEDRQKKSASLPHEEKKETEKKNVIGRRKRREEHPRSRVGSIASRIRDVYSEIFSFVKFNFSGRDFSSPFPQEKG